jgi:haloalkane dehalogenase
MAWGDKKTLTPAIHRHYTAAFPTPAQRQGTWTFMRELLGSSAWYDSLWARRSAIRSIPALLLWGMQDIAFKDKELARLAGIFDQPQVVRYPSVGHFVPDEAGEVVLPVIRTFVAQ